MSLCNDAVFFEQHFWLHSEMLLFSAPAEEYWWVLEMSDCVRLLRDGGGLDSNSGFGFSNQSALDRPWI